MNILWPLRKNNLLGSLENKALRTLKKKKKQLMRSKQFTVRSESLINKGTVSVTVTFIQG